MDEDKLIRIAAIIMLVVYAIGLPILCYLLAEQQRARIQAIRKILEEFKGDIKFPDFDGKKYKELERRRNKVDWPTPEDFIMKPMPKQNKQEEGDK